MELLGGMPSRLPKRCDVIVCRVVSCSHAGADLAQAHARRGRRVIFEDGISGILRELGPLKDLVDTAAEKGMVEDRRPVKGTFYRGYYEARGQRWFLRTCAPGRKPWTVNVPGARYKTRGEVMSAIRAFDLSSPLAEAETVAEAEAVVAPEVETVALSPKSDVLKAAELLAQALREAGIQAEQVFESLGLVVKLTTRHLDSPGGHACKYLGFEPDEKELKTLQLKEVTCAECKRAPFYTWLEWYGLRTRPGHGE